jgi:putative NADH-flavin reductase
VLIIGCGGRGQELARALSAAGHAVRGTTRSPSRVAAISAAGAEPFVGDPDRVGTLMEAIRGVTIVMWLLASASGERAEELHAGRLRMLCEKLVDTHVRGLVYEGAGSLPDEVLAGGAEIVRRAAATWNIPVEVLSVDPSSCQEWTASGVAAVERLLA